MPTLLCVPIMVESVDRARAEAIRAAELGADLVEYRVDRFFLGSDDEGEVLRLVEESPLPCIVTCRPTWEGGHYDGDEDERVSLYGKLGTAARPPAYIDTELKAYAGSADWRDLGARLILSMHDFAGRPTDLTRRVLAMQAEPAAAVCKVAYRARSLRDNLELFDILAERAKPTIALGMGEFGLASRVLAPKFGGFLTFASLRDESATAPGQPTITDLLDRYRFRSIGPATKVYGVVGWPVGHSMSPLIHNAGFEAVGHDGVYLPLPIAVADPAAQDSVAPAGSRCHCPPDSPAVSWCNDAYLSFKATMLELVHHPRLDFAGCSVTMPHKGNLVRLAREAGWALDECACESGAGNTLVVERDGAGAFARARVANTDAGAVVGCLAGVLGELRGRSIVVLGAGGVARAIAFGLAAAGAQVTLTNRSPDRAAQLAADINIAFPETARPLAWAERGAAAPDAYINCTPIGMLGGPAPHDSPLPPGAFAERNITLLETVYNPVRTRLLSRARDAGWRTIDGVAMFVDQGARQFELWTSRPAPRDRFDHLVRDALGG